MPVICPKCNAVRKESDTVPDWQCPACGVAYAKAAQRVNPPVGLARPAAKIEIAPDQRFPVFKSVMIVAALVVAAGWTHWKNDQQDNEWASVDADCRPGQPEVVLFARTDCGYCHQVKDYLQANSFCYTAKITNRDRSALDEFRQIRGKGVPLLIIGAERSDGYDREWMETKLQK